MELNNVPILVMLRGSYITCVYHQETILPSQFGEIFCHEDESVDLLKIAKYIIGFVQYNKNFTSDYTVFTSGKMEVSDFEEMIHNSMDVIRSQVKDAICPCMKCQTSTEEMKLKRIVLGNDSFGYRFVNAATEIHAKTVDYGENLKNGLFCYGGKAFVSYHKKARTIIHVSNAPLRLMAQIEEANRNNNDEVEQLIHIAPPDGSVDLNNQTIAAHLIRRANFNTFVLYEKSSDPDVFDDIFSKDTGEVDLLKLPDCIIGFVQYYSGHYSVCTTGKMNIYEFETLLHEMTAVMRDECEEAHCVCRNCQKRKSTMSQDLIRVDLGNAAYTYSIKVDPSDTMNKLAKGIFTEKLKIFITNRRGKDEPLVHVCNRSVVEVMEFDQAYREQIARSSRYNHNPLTNPEMIQPSTQTAEMDEENGENNICQALGDAITSRCRSCCNKADTYDVYMA